ncbi:hypothetical protein PRIPAC_70565, partial [Pristionchus pacificus]
RSRRLADNSSLMADLFIDDPQIDLTGRTRWQNKYGHLCNPNRISTAARVEIITISSDDDCGGRVNAPPAKRAAKERSENRVDCSGNENSMDSTKPANRPIRPFVKKSMARRSSDVALFRADANPSDSEDNASVNGRRTSRSVSHHSDGPLRRSTSHNVLNNSDLANRADTSKDAKTFDKKKKPSPTDAIVEAMENMSTDKVNWKRILVQQEAKDSDDEEIDVEVRDHADTPDQHWFDLAAEMEASGKDYEIDYIVAIEPHLKADNMTKGKTKLLTKWTKFAKPTWITGRDINPKGRGEGSKSSDQVNLAISRQKVLEKLEERLRAECGDKFDQKFPHRWIDIVENKGDYVKEESALYENKIVAWEWRMNYEYARQHKHKVRAGCSKDAAPPQPIYVVNWADRSPVPGIDGGLKFTTKMMPTERVSTILANTHEMDWVKCSTCTPSCSFPREHFHAKKHCCGVIYPTTKHYGNGKQYISRLCEPEAGEAEGKGALTTQEIECSAIVECTDACACNGLAGRAEKGTNNYCRQMVLQRGRQVPLFVFREDTGGESGKGWGLRAGEPIARGDFVTEYVGKVMSARDVKEFLAAENSYSHYFYDMRYGWAENLDKTDRVRNRVRKMKNGKNADMIRRHRPFTVDASEMGNESRFINHSCEPNLVSMAVYVERHGEFYHRIGLFARRNIEFGEELTFDYFPNTDAIDSWKLMFRQCRCESALCKMKEEHEDDEDSESEEKKNEDGTDDDAYDTVDSFLSDDEEYVRRCEANKTRQSKKTAEKNKEKPKTKNEEAVREPEKHAVCDLRRDPFEIMVDRYTGDREMAERTMNERRQRGILHRIEEHGPAVSMDEVIRKGKELYEARQKAREARERERKARGATESDDDPKAETKGRRRRCKKLP